VQEADCASIGFKFDVIHGAYSIMILEVPLFVPKIIRIRTKIQVLGDVTPYRLVNSHRRFEGS
jgi:hypothetical protein